MKDKLIGIEPYGQVPSALLTTTGRVDLATLPASINIEKNERI